MQWINMGRRPGVFIAALALTGGCSAPAPTELGPDELVLRTLLAGLASGGRAICVDNRATGPALSLWRDSSVVARAARVAGWTRPTVLLPFRTSPDQPDPGGHSTRSEPDFLPHVQASMLDAAANRAALQFDETAQTSLAAAWMPPTVATRWWPLNRFRHDCLAYRLSRPARAGDIAFVQVQIDRRATVYALRERQAAWHVIAETTPWLF